MKLRVLSALLLLFFPACHLAAQATSNARKFTSPARTFRFTYNFTVKDIPSQAKRVRVWIPVPQTDQHQTVRVLSVKAPVKTRMTQEPEYGNRMMYAEFQNPAPGKAEFTLEYKINAPRILARRLRATQANRSEAQHRARIDEPFDCA